jgi:hypothetical protein
MPQMPEGAAVYGNTNPLPGVRNLEWRTIAYMISAIGPDWQQYLSFYFLQRNDLAGGEGPHLPNSAIQNEAIRRTAHVISNRRYMICVHTKLMIVDDRYLILGSANINERSMSGDHDTEICVALWPGSNRTEAACETAIRGLRQSLVMEHLGTLPPNVDQPYTPECRDFLQQCGRDNYISLLAEGRRDPRMQGHLVMFPFDVDVNRNWSLPAWVTGVPIGLVQYMIDSINTGDDGEDDEHVSDYSKGYWRWQSNVPHCCSSWRVGKERGSAVRWRYWAGVEFLSNRMLKKDF